MTWRNVLALFILGLCFCPVIQADELGSGPTSRLTQFDLSDFRGKSWELEQWRDRPVMVVAFLGVECPLAKLYSQRLVELAKEFADRGVAFVGVDANPQDSLAEMAAHARRFSIQFPFVRDPQQSVVAQLGATRTPEVFVLDDQRQVRYHGRIDDQYGIGYVRQSPTENYLRDAIEALLGGHAIAMTHQPAVGCLIGKPKIASTPESADGTTPRPTTGHEVTYSKHIAPIFRDACVSCHRSGEIGPFAMTDYNEVAGWAEMIAEVVAEKRMPPWHANPEFGHFANDISLNEQQRELIARWVADGAPEGDPADLPEPKQYVEGWQLSRTPDLVLEMSKQPFKVPATGEVKYQYFLVDPGFTEDKWISQAQIVPGNRSVVHHILVFVREKGSRRELGGERGFLVGYVPGSVSQPYPQGAAKRIPAGSELIFQVHYTPIGSPQTDLSKIGFLFADPQQIDQEVITTSAVQVRLDIPPHEANYQTEAWLPESLPECQLLGMAPHMHLRGKSFSYQAIVPGQEPYTILDVPRYDFNWQTAYRLAEPLVLAAGSKIYCRATFDNSAGNLNNPDPSARVRWGDQTDDEMMIGYFDIMVPRGSQGLVADKGSARRELIRRLLRDGILKRLDLNGDGQVSRDEVPQRWKNQFDLLDADGNGLITPDELKD